MPFYEIHHAVPLNNDQFALIAEKITQTHSERFTTPRHFVNVKFVCHDPAVEPPTFVAGKPRRTNYILAHVRPGGSRTATDFNNVASEIAAFWDRDIAPSLSASGPKSNGASASQEYEMHAVFMLGGIVGGVEAGLTIPQAGQDVAWMKENWGKIEAKANGENPGPGGKEMWAEMIEEVKERKLMNLG